MPIPRRLLVDDEEVLVDQHPHWVVLFAPAVVTAAALAAAIAVVVRFPNAPVAVAPVLAIMVLVPACWLALRMARWRSTSVVVTTGRLLQRRGLLGRDVVQVRLSRLADVHCRQRFWARLVGTGDVVVELADGEPGWVIHDVHRPHRLQGVVSRQLDEPAPDPRPMPAVTPMPPRVLRYPQDGEPRTPPAGMAPVRPVDPVQWRAATVIAVPENPVRYRCRACGNLTRFDVVIERRTRAFHHYSVGGELEVEDEEVLTETIQSVSCRWCGHGNAVEVVADAPGAEGAAASAG